MERVLLKDILNYIEGDTSRRCFIEGEAVLEANHLLLCGFTSFNDSELTLKGFCLKTSNLKGEPHEITVTLRVTAEGKCEINGYCTCKAGSPKCKHILAVLLCANRNNFNELADLSCTDLKQKWGGLAKAHATELYKPVPVEKFCHTKPMIHVDFGDELNEKMRNLLCEHAPESELKEFLMGRNDQPSDESTDFSEEVLQKSLIVAIVMNSDHVFRNQEGVYVCFNTEGTIFLPYIEIEEEIFQFYLNNVEVDDQEAIKIAWNTLYQSGVEWMKARQIRITGSVAYGLYTYSKNKNPDWDKKLSNHFQKKNFTNKAIVHGLKNEDKAIKKYMEETKKVVEECGMITLPNLGWIGYSPDGIVYKDRRLVEVKCPVEGELKNVNSVLPKLPYIKIEKNEKATLKQKHAYYGQVQWGMALLNFKFCDFVIYSPFDDSVKIIEVERDVNFCHAMMTTLCNTYFKIILPYIVKNNICDEGNYLYCDAEDSDDENNNLLFDYS